MNYSPCYKSDKIMLEKFRIAQIADERFKVQAEKVETKTTGYLWWKKTETTKKFEDVSVVGGFYWCYRGISNRKLFETYKTQEEAEKWIKDYHKYPIYMDVITYKK